MDEQRQERIRKDREMFPMIVFIVYQLIVVYLVGSCIVGAVLF